MSETKTIERRALQLEQPGGHVLYMFTLSPSEILQVADISRISRDDEGQLIGYQRDQVRSHVNDIRDYLRGDDIVFPNAIILALDGEHRFRSSRGPGATDGLSRSGTLEICLGGDRKPAWIVDGQQRAFALADVMRDDLPIPVSAFVADQVSVQRDQFLRVNNTKPLPRGLVTELLPEVVVPISRKLGMRKLPAAICDQLNRQDDSPFQGMIRRPSSAPEERKQAPITDTSIVKMLEESLQQSSGCLFPYRNLATGEADTETIWLTVTAYWAAVRDTFPEAWGLPSTESRLMHGAGIRAMGRLMDKVMATVNPNADDAHEQIMAELGTVAPICRWLDGQWEDLGDMAWNDIQNTPKHVRALSNLLIRRYVTQRMKVA
ncbi:tgtA5 cluster protein 1 [Euzebya pacifica]|uniref:TgtA5 cluster protein 1 n=1 Tax=Euzebya pacifica TaxID=1608957 RepID=A0A346XS53_9ACTN|nr:DGQHR domain-containing protein DpdB [Euzebya pacifica]AXV05050.1 tgtA5 cluster protein 1 [Euzebya pacifica]